MDSTAARNSSAWVLMAVLTLALALAVAGCQPQPARRQEAPLSKQVSGPPPENPETEHPQPTYSPTPVPAVLGTRLLGSGQRVLTDSHGRTLYIKDRPSSRVPHCSGVCTNIWHPVDVGSSKVRSTIAGLPARFTTLPRPGGLHQLTVNEHRLYTCVLDKRPGQMNGEGFRTGDEAGEVFIWSAVVVPSTAPATIHLQP